MKKLITILFILIGLVGYSQVTIQDTTTVNATLLQIDSRPIGIIFSAEYSVIEPAFYREIKIVDTLNWTTVPDSLYVLKADLMDFVSRQELDSLINEAIKQKFSVLCEDL